MALTQKQVSELYVAIFNRASEGEGNKYWQQQSADAKAAANNMLATPDAKAYFGTSLDSNQAFIEHIYLNTLNKTYAQDKAGIDYWVSLLNAGTSRGEVVASLVAAVANYSSSTDPITKAAYDQFNYRVEVSNYMANTVEKAPANYATSTKFATTGTTGLVVTNSASTVTTAKTSVDTMKPVPGQTFTLTTGADVLVMTTGDDTITGTVGTLNSNDIILDNSTTDNDVLNATITDATLKPTIKNIEKANLTWASNANMVFDAVNSTGNSFNVTANALAFSGNVAFSNLGTNNVAVDSKVTGTLLLQNVVKSTVNAGAATAVTLTKGIPTVVGEKTSADITVNNNVTFTNAAATGVENVTLRSTVEGAKVTGTAGASQIVDQLTVAGDKSITYNGVVTGEKIVNSLTAGKLTVESTDVGALNTSNINANLISLKGATGVTTVTVANNQNFLVDNAAATTATTAFTSATANAVTNLETKAGITSLNITGISTLNLDAKAATTIGTLVTDAENNVNITGDSKTTINAMTGSTTVSIDASKLTGEFDITSAVNVATGIVGSSTAKNTISTGVTTANATVITGSADDKITAATTTGALTINAGDGKNTVNAQTVTTGTAKITTGSGNDTIDLSGLTTGKATVTSGAGDDKVTLNTTFTGTATEFTFDGGAGTDTLVIGAVDLKAAKVFNLTSVEEMTITSTATLAGSQLSGKAYAIKAAGSNGILNVDVVNPNAATAITTDLSGLNFSTSTTSNFSSVVINGIAGVADTIKATTMNDTITVGGTAKDTVDLTSGGADIITIANDASKYSTTADNMVSIKGFNAVASTTAVDTLNFAATAALAGTKANVDVKTAISGNTGTEAVFAGIDGKGILTISGIDSGKIDTLAEWMKVAELTVKDAISGSAGAAADTLAFAFNGNTYVYNLKATGAVADDNIVELVGVTGITGLAAAAGTTPAQIDAVAAANTIVIA